jgi:hypothetical protein
MKDKRFALGLSAGNVMKNWNAPAVKREAEEDRGR